MSPRPRKLHSVPPDEDVVLGKRVDVSTGTWRCDTCHREFEGFPGEPTKDPKFRIGKCPECGYAPSMFLKVR